MKRMILSCIIILLGLILVGYGKDDYKHNSKHEISLKRNSKQKTSVNKEIANTLSKEKKEAQQGRHDSEFAKYINSITYTGHTNITVYVNKDFINLPEHTKTNYLNKVQLMVQLPLLNHSKITNDDCSQGLFIKVKFGSDSIGHSKTKSHKEYKFNN